LAADGGASDEEVSRLVVVGTSTVYRVKKRFVEEGVAARSAIGRAPARSAS
jgi:transposase